MSTIRKTWLAHGPILVAAGAAVFACASEQAGLPGLPGTGGASGVGGPGHGGTASTGGVITYGGSQNTGGLTSTGGAPGTGSTPGTGGASGAYTFVGTVTAAPNQSVIQVPSTFLSCASGACQYAHCAPKELVSAEQQALLGLCADGVSYCVPDDFIATLGKFTLKTCNSVSGFEGRCISTCVPQVTKMADVLPQDVCDETERCAPCYYPWPVGSGESDLTGACSAGVGDAPTEPKQTFALCGDSRGLCVPADLVPADLVNAVPRETCNAGELCAPIEKVKDLSYKFPSCAPQLGGLPADPTQPGGCVPQYIITAYAAKPDGGNAFATALTQSDCTTVGDICAPCTDPLTLVVTGACL